MSRHGLLAGLLLVAVLAAPALLLSPQPPVEAVASPESVLPQERPPQAPPKDPPSILHIYTVATGGSIQRALDELGYTYSLYGGIDWTGIDFTPYDIVLIGVDGGAVEEASLAKIRSDVIDAGKRAIFFGGTCYQPFALGVDEYLVPNDTNNYCWALPASPHWTVVNSNHPLATGLPATYNFVNPSASYYQLRATDPTLEVVAENGDGHAAFFYKGHTFPLPGGTGSLSGGDLIWFINSPFQNYWQNEADFALLKQVVQNALTYEPAGLGAIHGHVYDAYSQTPLAQALVTAIHEQGARFDDTTDATGYYTLTAAWGTYTVTAAHPHYTTGITTAVQVVTGSATLVDFLLTPRGRLFGYVTDADNGFPLRATIVADNGMAVTSDPSSGYYEIYLDGGSYVVTATAPHYAPQSVLVTLAPGTTTHQDFALLRAVSWIPSPLHVTLDWQATSEVEATLINRGTEPYDFVLAEVPGGMVPAVGWAARGSPAPSTEEKGKEGTGSRVFPSGSGGPDPFGYIFVDSQEPGGPEFEWIEIAPPAGGNGTPLGLHGFDDTYYWPLELSFSFPFYGSRYNELAIATNGTLYFINGYIGYANQPIPGDSGYGINTFIAHWWDDLYISPGEVYYRDDGNRLIVEFYRVSGCCATPDSATWEVILYPDGSILFQYLDTDLNAPAYDHGAGATVGIQGDTATGLQYGYNAPVLSDGLAICFLYPGSLGCGYGDVPWLAEDPISGTVPAGSALHPTVYFSATVAAGCRQPGDYYAGLKMRGDPSVYVPVTLTVLPAANMGNVVGTITDRCTGAPVRATVHIAGGEPITQTVSDPASGRYTAWLFAGTYAFSFQADGYLGQETTLEVPAGQVVVYDVQLVPDRPCLEVDPTSLQAWLTAGDEQTQTLTLVNRGGQPLVFQITEQEGEWIGRSPGHAGWIASGQGTPSSGIPQADIPWLSEEPMSGTVPAGEVFQVEVAFHGLLTMSLGVYTAGLRVAGNDPVVGYIVVPAVLHIVEAYQAPTAGFVSDSPVVAGQPMHFTNTTVPGIPPETWYTWQFGDGFGSGETNPTHWYAGWGTFTVTLEACNARLCDRYAAAVWVLPHRLYLPLVLRTQDAKGP